MFHVNMKKRFSRHLTPGLAFPDYIGFEQKPSRKHYDFSEKEPNLRGFLLLFSLFILLGILIFKIFFLQILQGQYYKALADKNRTKTILIRAPRGIIFDRNGEALVFNVPGFRETVNKKTRLLTREEAIKLMASGKKDLEIDSLREYTQKEILAHVLGYIGQISEEELKNPLFSNYQHNDLIGKSGIEQYYEEKLKGIDGKQLVEVNAAGKIVRTLGQIDPIPGQNITLTIDTKLQKTVYQASLPIKKGAIIVSNPEGEILAMVSKPAFDPNLFTLGQTYKPAIESQYQNLQSILLDTDNQPLLNRAISGVYPPGSTFKIITAAAGLQDKIIDENYEVIDEGVLKIKEFSFANWYFTQYGRTEGSINIVRAIKRSNDIFFYKLAEKVGIEKISEMAHKFVLGEKVGIDLEGEEKGLVPTEEWKKKIIKEDWYLGDTYHYGIGQGYLLTTPLQVNNLTQVIANGGTLYQPHLIKSQKSRLPKPGTGEQAKVKSQKFLSDKTVSLIKQGMVESCSEGGVVWPLFEFKVQNSKLKVDGRDILEIPISSGSADVRQVSLACKTGTAEHGDKNTLPHAWITLFAPAYNPEIVITVLAESSGEGSNIAAPIAKKILEDYFTKQ